MKSRCIQGEIPQVGDSWTPIQERILDVKILDVEIIGVDKEFVEYLFIYPNPEGRNMQFVSDTIENFCKRYKINQRVNKMKKTIDTHLIRHESIKSIAYRDETYVSLRDLLFQLEGLTEDCTEDLVISLKQKTNYLNIPYDNH
jgi:hypothetical protein